MVRRAEVANACMLAPKRAIQLDLNQPLSSTTGVNAFPALPAWSGIMRINEKQWVLLA
jgi:hypothetical protein